MAYKIHSCLRVQDPITKQIELVAEYYADSPADINDLPTRKISESSTALIKSTGKVAFIIHGKWEVPSWMQ